MASLMAVATNDKGPSAASVPVIVTVTRNAAPTIRLSSLAANASFTAPASIALTADAADSDGRISQVSFYHDGVFIGATMSAPYTVSWTQVPCWHRRFVKKALKICCL